jgi:hypothetical protein
MDNKEIKIDVPEGYEIDEENSTFKCIKFKKKKTNLPSTWEEFCNDYPIREGETWIISDSNLGEFVDCPRRVFDNDRNVLPSMELAEAMLALCQLIQLRDCYNKGWKPDWTNDRCSKFTIKFYMDTPICETNRTLNRVLAFKSAELRDLFFRNFRDLIETAKPLL